MSTDRYRSLIRFRKVDPYPSPRIEGGTVEEVVHVEGDDTPIATIVHKVSDNPPDPWSGGRVRVYWHMVPEDPEEPIRTTEMPASMRHDYFRESYGDAYRIKLPPWKKIASGDDCEILGKVLEWAGIEIDWEEHAYWVYFSFDDLFYRCDHLDYYGREWGGHAPGLSGTWYTVKTDNPEALKEQIKHLMRDEIPLELQEIHRKRQEQEAIEAAKRAAQNARRREQRARKKTFSEGNEKDS